MDENLDDLTKECLEAPRFGVNARALILRAVEGGDERDVDYSQPLAHLPLEHLPTTSTSRGREGLSSAEAHDIDALWMALPLKERPIAPYLPRSKVPKVIRQKFLDRCSRTEDVLLQARFQLTSA
jgi:hypothetical protein